MKTILTKKCKMKSAIALAIICIMVLLSLPLPSYAESSTIEIVGKKYSFEKDDD